MRAPRRPILTSGSPPWSSEEPFLVDEAAGLRLSADYQSDLSVGALMCRSRCTGLPGTWRSLVSGAPDPGGGARMRWRWLGPWEPLKPLQVSQAGWVRNH